MGRKKIYKNEAEKKKAMRARKRIGAKKRIYIYPKERYNEGLLSDTDMTTNTIDGVRSFLKGIYKTLDYSSFGNESEEEAVLKLLRETKEIEVTFI